MLNQKQVIIDPLGLLQMRTEGDQVEILDADPKDNFIKSATPWADLEKKLNDDPEWDHLDKMLGD